MDVNHHHHDTKKTRKLEITEINNTLSSNTKELFRLRNHSKTLVTKIKKLKNNRKTKHSNKDFEGKVLEKQEENHRLRNHNQET